ncbi:hypothetical protein ACMFMG_000792 [Clarireedia jacksonii]
MIISTSKWGVWVVWFGSLGMAHSHWNYDHGQAGHDKPTTTQNMPRESNEGIFDSTWSGPEPRITLGNSYTFNYTAQNVPRELGFLETAPSLMLCYTTNKTEVSSSNVYEALSTSLHYTCPSTANNNCSFESGSTGMVNLSLGFSPDMETLPHDSQSQENAFFLCFADNKSQFTFTCRSYSPFFGIELPSPAPAKRQASDSALIPGTSSGPSSTASGPAPLVSSIESKVQTLISTPLSVTASSIFLSQSGATASLAPTQQSSSSTSTSYIATVTTPPSANTPTPTNAADVSSTPASKSSSSSGLSLGAKIGIALGALGFIFLLLLAALFLIRRRRRTHPPNTSQTPENHLLASPFQNNDSRDLYVAEKLAPTTIQERETHTPLTSYTEHDTSSHQHLPLPGSAFTTSTPVPISPRRSQAATTISRDASVAVSRAVSDASQVSRPGSRELGIGERSLFDQEPYTDDVSHSGAGGSSSSGNLNVPKVYKGALQAPFLSEPGMSAEEVARLEEEERRIDEAIAEAEEERKRARMRSAGAR